MTETMFFLTPFIKNPIKKKYIDFNSIHFQLYKSLKRSLNYIKVVLKMKP